MIAANRQSASQENAPQAKKIHFSRRNADISESTVIFHNFGVSMFFPPNRKATKIPTDSLSLIPLIQPIVSKAYQAHNRGDFSVSLPAFEEFFEMMIAYWPQSQPLTNYCFMEKARSGNVGFTPLSILQIVRMSLEDMRAVLIRNPSKADKRRIRKIYDLIQSHFMDFAQSASNANRRLMSNASVAARKKFLEAGKKDFNDVGRLLAKNVVEIKRTPLELVAQATTDAKVGFFPHFDSDQYERTTDEILSAAEKLKDPDWRAYLYFLAGWRYMSLRGTAYALPGGQEISVKAFQSAINIHGAKFPIEDSLVGARKGSPIEPYARLFLSTIYSDWLYDGGVVVKKTNHAAREMETILRRYDDPGLLIHGNITGDYSILGSAMAGLLRIYGKSEKSHKIALIFATQYPNMDFVWNGWWIGQTRPEALRYLADEETHRVKKIHYLLQIIEDYPGAWTGKAGSDDGGPYDTAAEQTLFSLAKSSEEKESFCRRIIHSPKISPRVKFTAKVVLQRLKLDHDAPSIFKKPATYIYNDTSDLGCSYKYYYDADKISEEQIKRWVSFSPRAYYWMVGNFRMDPNDEALKILSEEVKESPPDLRPMIDDYARESRFWFDVNRRKGEFLKSGDIAILKRPIEGIDPKIVDPEFFAKIPEDSLAKKNLLSVSLDWVGSIYKIFYMKYLKGVSAEKDWRHFLKGRKISEVVLYCGSGD